jgi:hypothetical protein
MQNEQEKPALEDLKITEEAPIASEELIHLEQSEEDPKNDAKSKKATIVTVAAGLAGGLAGIALGAQNADLIGSIFDDEPVPVEPDPDPNAGPADEPVAQNVVEPEAPVEVEPEVTPVAEDTATPANAADPVGVDLNGDGTVDVVAVDANQDGTAEAMATDEDHDGAVDTLYIDTDHDGDMDTIMIDTNQDGTFDTENALPTDQEITLQLETPEHHEETPQETTVEAPVDTNDTNDIVDNEIPQDEFDPNADMSEWA